MINGLFEVQSLTMLAKQLSTFMKLNFFSILLLPLRTSPSCFLKPQFLFTNHFFNISTVPFLSFFYQLDLDVDSWQHLTGRWRLKSGAGYVELTKGAEVLQCLLDSTGELWEWMESVYFCENINVNMRRKLGQAWECHAMRTASRWYDREMGSYESMTIIWETKSLTLSMCDGAGRIYIWWRCDVVKWFQPLEIPVQTITDRLF